MLESLFPLAEPYH